jgi:hypothetical protein
MSDAYYVDLISDLNLTETDTFDWSGKASSLFCIVAGNVSSDMTVLGNTLRHLSENYRGVFFIDGSLEHAKLEDYESRIVEIKSLCDAIPGVVYMFNHVVILNGVAFVAVNGWYGNRKHLDTYEDLEYIERYTAEDVEYLSVTIKKLQAHQDVKKIVVVTNSMPSEYLGFNSPKVTFNGHMKPAIGLIFDTNLKVNNWLFGTDDIEVDVVLANRRYVNNPVVPGVLYFPKRVDV